MIDPKGFSHFDKDGGEHHERISNDGTDGLGKKALHRLVEAVYENRGTITLTRVMFEKDGTRSDATEQFAKMLGLLAICILYSDLPDGRIIRSFFPDDLTDIFKEKA